MPSGTTDARIVEIPPSDPSVLPKRMVPESLFPEPTPADPAPPPLPEPEPVGEVHDPAGPQPDEPLEPVPTPGGPGEPPTPILPDPDAPEREPDREPADDRHRRCTVEHDEFIGPIQARARLASGSEAERALAAMLETLAERLTCGLASNIAAQAAGGSTARARRR